MYFFLLVLGIAIWWAAHLFKRLAPTRRAELGPKARGPIALALLLAVVLMVIGYRGAELIPVYTPFPGAGYINNILMVLAFILFGVGSTGSWLSTRMRHPMLISVKIWALAHLLVNGDVASILLFGTMLAWAVVEVIVINKTSGDWTKGTDGPTARDAGLLAVWLVIYVVVAGIHVWLGHNPFLGSYG